MSESKVAFITYLEGEGVARQEALEARERLRLRALDARLSMSQYVRRALVSTGDLPDSFSPR